MVVYCSCMHRMQVAQLPIVLSSILLYMIRQYNSKQEVTCHFNTDAKSGI